MKEIDDKAKAIELLNVEAAAITAAASRVGEEFLKAHQLVIKSIDGNKKIVFLAMGKSHFVAAKLAASFMSTGITAIFVHPAEAIHGDLGIIHEGDLCVMISKSGNTPELIGILPYFEKRNSIVAITGNNNSILAKAAEVVLDASVEKEACPINMLPTASTTVALALGDALLSITTESREFKKDSFKIFHPGGSLGKRLHQKVEDVMLPLTKIPYSHESITLEQVSKLMSLKPVGAFCSINQDMSFKGLMVDGDLRRAIANGSKMSDSIESHLIKTAVTLSPDMLIDEAIAALERKDRKITSAPVLSSDKKLIGFVRIHDLL